MKRTLGALVALVCVALLSSCSFLPPRSNGLTFADSTQQVNIDMKHIAAAVKNRDVAALKKLFSTTARKKAPDLDSGLEYFLSVFPSGPMTWKLLGGAPGETGEVDHGKKTVVLFANYTVSANGKKYELYFADYTVNQVEDPHNVGLYALGAVPSSDSGYTVSGSKKPFNVWASQFWTKDVGSGTPGVYVPHK